jgi:hypothetical protein
MRRHKKLYTEKTINSEASRQRHAEHHLPHGPDDYLSFIC